jgi:hypothetical protein
MLVSALFNSDVIVALVAAVPASLAAYAAFRGTRQNKAMKEDLATGNGKTIGQYAVHLSHELGMLSGQLDAHTAQDEANFTALNQRLDDLEGTSGSD